MACKLISCMSQHCVVTRELDDLSICRSAFTCKLMFDLKHRMLNSIKEMHISVTFWTVFALDCHLAHCIDLGYRETLALSFTAIAHPSFLTISDHPKTNIYLPQAAPFSPLCQIRLFESKRSRCIAFFIFWKIVVQFVRCFVISHHGTICTMQSIYTAKPACHEVAHIMKYKTGNVCASDGVSDQKPQDKSRVFLMRSCAGWGHGKLGLASSLSPRLPAARCSIR